MLHIVPLTLFLISAVAHVRAKPRARVSGKLHPKRDRISTFPGECAEADVACTQWDAGCVVGGLFILVMLSFVVGNVFVMCWLILVG